jgi:hypothetical protein
VPAAYALGALLLAGQAVVHLQQYIAIFYGVSWVGPMFLVDAVLSAGAIIGLAYPRTRPLAALAGVGIATGALGGLVVSYGRGLFGWQEAGFRTPVAAAVIMEVGTVILLSAALAGSAASGQAKARHRTFDQGVAQHGPRIRLDA